MKRVWKCVASVRRGFHLLVDHVVGWIANTIVWTEWHFDDAYKLWVMLGLSASFV